MHHLRHAHASWLVNGGADLQVIKARLGHKSIRTTERYLHTLENADETALAALNNIRQREPPPPSTPPHQTLPAASISAHSPRKCSSSSSEAPKPN